MGIKEIVHSRTTAVVAGAAILVTLGGVSGAFAAARISSSDIRNQSIQSRDIGKNGVGASEIRQGAVGGTGVRNGSLGMQDLNGYTQGKIDAGGNPHYAGPHWSIVDRNVIGNGDSYLRAGPMNPPSGIGSLGLRTGAATDKATFGNQQDFNGQLVKDIENIGFSVFNTRENMGTPQNNVPSITIEIDPNVDAVDSSYSSLVYVPDERPDKASQWTTYDATQEGKWGLSGNSFTGTQCSLNGAMCSWDEMQQYLNDGGDDATVMGAVQITKGRDAAFSGAVDNLVWNDTTYDFEPTGVTTK